MTQTPNSRIRCPRMRKMKGDLIWKRKKEFTHSATRALCAPHCEQGCCIFLGSYKHYFDSQRSHGVRDAPSHGNGNRPHARTPRSRTVKEIKQSAIIEPNGYIGSEQTVDDLRTILCCAQFRNVFYFVSEKIRTSNSSVWSGDRSAQYGPGNQTFMGGKFTRKCTRGENHWAFQTVSNAKQLCQIFHWVTLSHNCQHLSAWFPLNQREINSGSNCPGKWQPG